jgi:5-carboxymethyl-2-hydroxymuconate isomerase
MPHLTLEYSANLRNFSALKRLWQTPARVLVAQQADGAPVYPIGGARVRAIVAHEFCVGDGRFHDAAFVHAHLKVGAGRSDAVGTATGHALFEAMKSHFAREYAAQGLALSLEISEFSEAGTWKHNNLHARFAASVAGGAAAPAAGFAGERSAAPRTPADPAAPDANA